MKRIIFTVFAVLLCIICLALFSCGEGDNTTTDSTDTTTTAPRISDITYELNGGTNNENNPATYKEGNSFELAVPTKENYLFAGWYMDSEFKNFVTHIKRDTSGNITLYAKWIELEGNITLQLEGDSYKVVGCNEALEYLYIKSKASRH